jgi:hypothetical protein
MSKFGGLAAAVAMVATISLGTMSVGTAGAFERAQAGELRCDVSGGVGLILGSQKEVDCTFKPVARGPLEHYRGKLTRLGLDLGVSNGAVMVWGVWAPTERPAGALAGTYGGATADASVGKGVGGNVLAGGNDRTVELQPVSVESDTGINLAAGVAGLELQWLRR